MTFAARRIAVTFIGKVTVKVENLRIFARIVKMGGVGMGTAEVTIYGLTLDLMNQLATFGTRVHPQYNYKVRVEAGDAINGMSLVFVGTITQAWADFQAMPDVPFHVIAQAGAIEAVQTGTPTSIAGSADVATMIKGLAAQMGLPFENNGVNVKIADPYFWGSPRNQVKAIAEAAGIDWIIDDDKVAIWPANAARAGDTLEVSPQTGMAYYPTFTDYGVLVKLEFRRAITYATKFNVQSDITPACGVWNIRLVDYDLQAREPHGRWFVTLGGVRDPGAAVIP